MAKKKILAVDDEPNILLSLEFILEEEGYDVYVARDGEEALELAEKIHPDLVLLDVAMPRKDGYDVCRILKHREDLADIKIVMLTAKGQPLEKKKGLELGANLYVTKPFSAEELLQKIRTVLAS
jgi:DNA-binding response OmpR family regulator